MAFVIFWPGCLSIFGMIEAVLTIAVYFAVGAVVAVVNFTLATFMFLLWDLWSDD